MKSKRWNWELLGAVVLSVGLWTGAAFVAVVAERAVRQGVVGPRPALAASPEACVGISTGRVFRFGSSSRSRRQTILDDVEILSVPPSAATVRDPATGHALIFLGGDVALELLPAGATS